VERGYASTEIILRISVVKEYLDWILEFFVLAYHQSSSTYIINTPSIWLKLHLKSVTCSLTHSQHRVCYNVSIAQSRLYGWFNQVSLYSILCSLIWICRLNVFSFYCN